MGGRYKTVKTLELTKIAKVALGLKFMGGSIILVSIVLTSNYIVDGEILIKYARQDCKSPMYATTYIIV